MKFLHMKLVEVDIVWLNSLSLVCHLNHLLFFLKMKESELLINNLGDSIIKKNEVILNTADLKMMANLQESTVRREMISTGFAKVKENQESH